MSEIIQDTLGSQEPENQQVVSSPAEQLLKEVASAICDADGYDPDDQFPWGAFYWEPRKGLARAAIAVIVERCVGIIEKKARAEEEFKNKAKELGSPVALACCTHAELRLDAVALDIRALIPGGAL